MGGRARDIILAIYVTGVVVYLAVITVGYVRSGLDFDAWKGEYLAGLGLLTTLLIKLPPTTAEAEATAQAAANGGGTVTEQMDVTADKVMIEEEK